jgi:hypothetical protein
MAEKVTQEQVDEYVAEKQAAKAAERRAVEERIDKETAKQVFLSEGGDPGDFERFYKDLKSERIKRAVIDKKRAAREAQRRSRISSI